MTATQRGTLVAAFEDRSSAQAAIRELASMGFREDQIGVTSREISSEGAVEYEEDAGDVTYAGEGGMAGLAAGAGVGALWGLGVVSGVLPAIGPAIAGGALAAILSSAAAGAAAAGLAGTLIGLGIPRDEAEYYEEEFKAGRTIVTVQTGGRYADVLAVLWRHGGYERAEALAEVPQAASSAAASRTIDVSVRREDVLTESDAAAGKAGRGAMREGPGLRVPVAEEHVDPSRSAAGRRKKAKDTE